MSHFIHYSNGMVVIIGVLAVYIGFKLALYSNGQGKRQIKKNMITLHFGKDTPAEKIMDTLEREVRRTRKSK